MVRTKADGGGSSGSSGRKVVAARAPRKALGGSGPRPSSSSVGESPSGKNKYAGGNAACPRPTPTWQKEISGFFCSNKNKENVQPSNQEDDDEIQVLEKDCEEQGSSKAGSSSS